MKRALTALFAAFLFAGIAAAQEGLYEYPAIGGYEYGLYGAELGEGYELGEYDEAGIGYPYGNLVLTTVGTQGQSIDMVITGPNGYSETFESEAGIEREIVELPVGVYSVAATDDGLQMGHALVEVRPGFGRALIFTLPPFEQFEGGIGEGYELEAGYYGAEEEFGDAYEPYGYYEVEGYETYENEESGAIVVAVEGYGETGEVIGYDELGATVQGHIVGPDDHRTEFGGESTVLEDLPAGLYSIAATAEGYQLAQSYLQVQPGQTALVRVRLAGLQAGLGATGAMTGVGAGLYDTWDADEDSLLTGEEFEAGLYGTLAGEDGELGEDEFNEGFGRLYEGFEGEGAFSDFDADADGILTENEFVGGYEPTLYTEWDANADATLTLEEYNRGFFSAVDANQDATIMAEEYEPFEGWFGRGFEENEGYEDGLTEEEWMGTGL